MFFIACVCFSFQVRIGLLQDPGDTVKELRKALSCDTSIPEQQVAKHFPLK